MSNKSQPSKPAARRRSSDRRWSASSSVHYFDSAGSRLEDVGPTAVKGVVRWRLDGRNRKRSFTGSNLAGQVRAFQALLAAAYEGDWPAAANGTPLQPTTLASVSQITPAEEKTETPAVRSLPTVAQRSDRPITVEDICDDYQTYMKTSKAKRGKERRGKTLEGYMSILDFIRAVLVYREGDPRLDHIDAKPGDPIRIHETYGLNSADLFRYIDERSTTNLNTREANERRAQKYAEKLIRRDEAIAANRPGRRPNVPEPPTLEEEVASARTVDESCRLLRAVITHAVSRDRMSYDPWTDQVQASVPDAETPHFTTRVVMAEGQVVRLAEGMSRFERTTTGRQVINGDRYSGLIILSGREAIRQGEVLAVRLSSVDLGTYPLQITLHESVSYISKSRFGENGGRQTVGLKHRATGASRRFQVSAPTDPMLRRHIDLYVPEPDPTSDNIDERDPLLFTTHTGSPIHPGNFLRDFFAPILIEVFTRPGEERFHHSTPRDLRKAGIVRLIREGWSLDRVAKHAGNSPAVIEKHYMGVFDEVRASGSPARSFERPVGLGDLSIDELEAELARRRMHAVAASGQS